MRLIKECLGQIEDGGKKRRVMISVANGSIIGAINNQTGKTGLGPLTDAQRRGRASSLRIT